MLVAEVKRARVRFEDDPERIVTMVLPGERRIVRIARAFTPGKAKDDAPAVQYHARIADRPAEVPSSESIYQVHWVDGDAAEVEFVEPARLEHFEIRRPGAEALAGASL